MWVSHPLSSRVPAPRANEPMSPAVTISGDTAAATVEAASLVVEAKSAKVFICDICRGGFLILWSGDVGSGWTHAGVTECQATGVILHTGEDKIWTGRDHCCV